MLGKKKPTAFRVRPVEDVNKRVRRLKSRRGDEGTHMAKAGRVCAGNPPSGPVYGEFLASNRKSFRAYGFEGIVLPTDHH